MILSCSLTSNIFFGSMSQGRAPWCIPTHKQRSGNKRSGLSAKVHRPNLTHASSINSRLLQPAGLKFGIKLWSCWNPIPHPSPHTQEVCSKWFIHVAPHSHHPKGTGLCLSCSRLEGQLFVLSLFAFFSKAHLDFRLGMWMGFSGVMVVTVNLSFIHWGVEGPLVVGVGSENIFWVCSVLTQLTNKCMRL